MSLIIETGAIVPGAESYASAAEFAAYADKFGADLPETEAAQEVLLRRAALHMQRLVWKGSRVQAQQPLAWPRVEVEVDGETLATNTIPPRIVQGQMALAAEIYADELDPPALRRGAVTREKVDVIEREYAVSLETGGAAPSHSQLQFADYLEAPLPLFVQRA